MRTRDVRATTAGVLFIAATATSLLATAFLGSLLEDSGFLVSVSQHQDRVLVGAFFQLLGAFTSAAIAITLYPVLKRYAAALALGAVGFRLIEGVFYALSAAGTLVLVSLSDQVTAAGTASAAVHTSGELVRSLRDSAGVVGVLAFYTGASAYYLIFYRSQLVPRWVGVARGRQPLSSSARRALGASTPLGCRSPSLSPMRRNEQHCCVWASEFGSVSPSTGRAHKVSSRGRGASRRRRGKYR